MKASKALKRLADVEESLSRVIERYATNEQSVKELLTEAKARVVHARKTVSTQAQPPATNGHAMKSAKSNNRPLPAGDTEPATSRSFKRDRAEKGGRSAGHS
jgi:hypothetical protein